MDLESSLHFPLLVRICNYARQARATDTATLLSHLSPDSLERRKECAITKRSTGHLAKKTYITCIPRRLQSVRIRPSSTPIVYQMASYSPCNQMTNKVRFSQQPSRYSLLPRREKTLNNFGGTRIWHSQ